MPHRIANLTVRALAAALRDGEISPAELASHVCLAAERIEPSRALLHFAPGQVRSDASALIPACQRGGLWGIAVSVKDLMDVRGAPTGCGSRSVTRKAAPAVEDAAFVSMWRSAGTFFTGKTHLNEHAYGITGENPWFGDCTQPGDPTLLTGGSSSGAAASVLGGAAWIGLGTDTGGSLRVPASLCGLVSLRAPGWFPDHRGIAPLAPSFDTLGWIQRWLGDVEFTATSLLGSAPAVGAIPSLRWMTGAVLNGCDPAVLQAFNSLRSRLSSAGLGVEATPAIGWESAVDTFAALQAREALAVHRTTLTREPGDFSPAVRARLEWARTITDDEAERRKEHRRHLGEAMGGLLAGGHVLVLPAAPMTQLGAGADHGANRRRILALTAPASLGVYPVLTVPDAALGGSTRVGYQFIAAPGSEWALVRLATELAERFGGMHGMPKVNLPQADRI
jgi:Asp-tRNA(Asn)/Glu-tRNA(Gln) amidotransferase A subunit family amidase